MITVAHIDDLLVQYRDWLKQKTSLRQLHDWVEITTPYLDRHNDCIQIFAKAIEDQKILLTDDGNTIQDLEMSGCKLDSPKRKQLLEVTLRGFGVELANGQIQVSASRDNFPLRKHNLIQAIVAVNDLFFLAAPTVTSLFLEDVQAWLDLCEIRYTPRVKFSGKAGYDHLFNFVIPKSKTKPERILQAISNPNKDSATSLAFACIDTKDVRASDSQFFAILNDTDRAVPVGASEALSNYNVIHFPWSRRDEHRMDLAA